MEREFPFSRVTFWPQTLSGSLQECSRSSCGLLQYSWGVLSRFLPRTLPRFTSGNCQFFITQLWSIRPASRSLHLFERSICLLSFPHYRHRYLAWQFYRWQSRNLETTIELTFNFAASWVWLGWHLFIFTLGAYNHGRPPSGIFLLWLEIILCTASWQKSTGHPKSLGSLGFIDWHGELA